MKGSTYISLFVLLFSVNSFGGIITFDEIESSDYYIYLEDTYTTESFVFSLYPSGNHYDFYTDDPKFYALGSSSPSYGGSVGLHASGLDTRIKLNATDGSLFSISNIDLMMGLYNKFDDFIPVEFLAITENDEVVTQTFDISYNVSNYSHFSFNKNFRNIKSLEWSQGAIFHSFDNLNIELVTEVPEPRTIFIFILALVILIFRYPAKIRYQ
jgi:hypothetical protein